MEKIHNILIVWLGGGCGAVCRFLTGGLLLRWYPHALLPLGTLFVNVVGCLLIGLLTGLAEHRHMMSQPVRLFLVTGCLGGFTTFSAFGYESFFLARTQGLGVAALNILLSVTLGVGAVVVGYGIAMRIPQ